MPCDFRCHVKQSTIGLLCTMPMGKNISIWLEGLATQCPSWSGPPTASVTTTTSASRNRCQHTCYCYHAKLATLPFIRLTVIARQTVFWMENSFVVVSLAGVECASWHRLHVCLNPHNREHDSMTPMPRTTTSLLLWQEAFHFLLRGVSHQPLCSNLSFVNISSHPLLAS